MEKQLKAILAGPVGAMSLGGSGVAREAATAVHGRFLSSEHPVGPGGWRCMNGSGAPERLFSLMRGPVRLSFPLQIR